MESCWKQNPEDRPTFSEIHKSICTLIEEQDSYNYISMMAIDLCPTECTQVKDDCSDELPKVEHAASIAFVKDDASVECEQDSSVVVEVH